MSKQQDMRDAMKLPAGETCDNCFAFRFCNGIGCSWSCRTECDYYPNRFRKAQTAKTEKAASE